MGMSLSVWWYGNESRVEQGYISVNCIKVNVLKYTTIDFTCYVYQIDITHIFN